MRSPSLCVETVNPPSVQHGLGPIQVLVCVVFHHLHFFPHLRVPL